MRTRTPMRVLLVAALTLALLPMLSTFAPGGQVAGFTTASPAVADQIWYQSVGRASATVACEKSITTELAAGWTNWAPSWDTWVNGGNGGFVCNRQITWAYDTPPVSCAAGAGAANTCIVGNTGPGGGIVFYVNEAAATGNRYMEAATSDLPGTHRWCTSSSPIAGVETSVIRVATIGTGDANTTAIIAVCGSGAANSARTYGTATAPAGSWFLPSLGELDEMYNQRNFLSGFSSGDFYWSSTQRDATYAWSRYFPLGFDSFNDKTLPNDRVRPVRAF